MPPSMSDVRGAALRVLAWIFIHRVDNVGLGIPACVEHIDATYLRLLACSDDVDATRFGFDMS
jgi:hypothetical protein